MQLTQVIHDAARADPDKIATIDGDRQQSWAQLQDRVARFAAALRAHDIGAGDRVAILALNGDRYTEFLFAVWWAGGAAVPMNTRWSAQENIYSLKDSGAKLLCVDQHFAAMMPEFQQADIDVAHFVLLDGPADGALLSYEALIADHAPCADADRSDDDLAGLFYTGGTTGFPKGVMISHKAIWYNNMVVAKLTKLDRHSRYLHAAPMFHMADFAIGGAAILMGATSIYVPSFDPSGCADIAERHGVTHLLLVPAMLQMVMEHPDFDPAKFQSVRYFVYGASPMPEGLLRAAMAQWPHMDFNQAYGQTEMAPVVTTLEGHDHILEGAQASRLRSAGRPVPGCSVKIIDDDGQEVPRGSVGEIIARSPGNMLGYWRLPEQTDATLIDGWVHTGDGAYQDEDGFIYIVDRLKDMIVSGGENVFSAEVESAISTHADVAAVAVIGIPSEKWGEAVHAIVIPKAETTPDEAAIVAHCRASIAGYKCPQSVSFRDDPFPLSGAGKVLKRELRAPYWEGQDRNVS